MRLLGLVTLLVACSSGTQAGSGDTLEVGGAAGDATEARAGASSVAGSASAQAGAGGSATGGDIASAAGEAGASVAGAPPVLIGVGGEAGEVGAGGEGGAPISNGGSGGSIHQGGTSTAGTGSAGTSGAGGGTVIPDPCDGIAHWNPSERWTDYVKGDQRVFGGILWHCQSTAVCTAYPGHASSPGWLKDADCKGGPTNEVAECQCLSGQCCDGCYVRPRSHLCGEVVRTAQCLGPVVNQCGGATDTIDKDWWNVFCDGAETTTCSRWGAHTKYTNGDCPAKTGCVESGDQASCNACAN